MNSPSSGAYSALFACDDCTFVDQFIAGLSALFFWRRGRALWKTTRVAGRWSLCVVRLDAATKLEQLCFKSLEFPNQRLDLLRRVFDMLGPAVIPSRPAADRDGQGSSVEGPPFTVSKEVALVARTDGIRQELHDRLRLLEIISKVPLDQLGHAFWALASFPLVAPPLAEIRIVRDSALQRANFSLEFRVGKHQLRKRDGVRPDVLCLGKIYVVRVLVICDSSRGAFLKTGWSC
jgi:hypothetical protein